MRDYNTQAINKSVTNHRTQTLTFGLAGRVRMAQAQPPNEQLYPKQSAIDPKSLTMPLAGRVKPNKTQRRLTKSDEFASTVNAIPSISNFSPDERYLRQRALMGRLSEYGSGALNDPRVAAQQGYRSVTDMRQDMPGTLENLMALVDMANPGMAKSQRDLIKYRAQRIGGEAGGVRKEIVPSINPEQGPRIEYVPEQGQQFQGLDEFQIADLLKMAAGGTGMDEALTSSIMRNQKATGDGIMSIGPLNLDWQTRQHEIINATRGGQMENALQTVLPQLLGNIAKGGAFPLYGLASHINDARNPEYAQGLSTLTAPVRALSPVPELRPQTGAGVDQSALIGLLSGVLSNLNPGELLFGASNLPAQVAQGAMAPNPLGYTQTQLSGGEGASPETQAWNIGNTIGGAIDIVPILKGAFGKRAPKAEPAARPPLALEARNPQVEKPAPPVEVPPVKEPVQSTPAEAVAAMPPQVAEQIAAAGATLGDADPIKPKGRQSKKAKEPTVSTEPEKIEPVSPAPELAVPKTRKTGGKKKSEPTPTGLEEPQPVLEQKPIDEPQSGGELVVRASEEVTPEKTSLPVPDESDNVIRREYIRGDRSYTVTDLPGGGVSVSRGGSEIKFDSMGDLNKSIDSKELTWYGKAPEGTKAVDPSTITTMQEGIDVLVDNSFDRAAAKSVLSWLKSLDDTALDEIAQTPFPGKVSSESAKAAAAIVYQAKELKNKRPSALPASTEPVETVTGGDVEAIATRLQDLKKSAIESGSDMTPVNNLIDRFNDQIEKHGYSSEFGENVSQIINRIETVIRNEIKQKASQAKAPEVKATRKTGGKKKSTKEAGFIDRNTMTTALLIGGGLLAAPAAYKAFEQMLDKFEGDSSAQDNAQKVLASIAVGAALIGVGGKGLKKLTSVYPGIAKVPTQLIRSTYSNFVKPGSPWANFMNPESHLRVQGLGEEARNAYSASSIQHQITNELETVISQQGSGMPETLRAESLGHSNYINEKDFETPSDAVKAIKNDGRYRILRKYEVDPSSLTPEETVIMDAFERRYNEVADVAWEAGVGPVVKANGIADDGALAFSVGDEIAVHLTDDSSGQLGDFTKGEVYHVGKYDIDNKIMSSDGVWGFFLEGSDPLPGSVEVSINKHFYPASLFQGMRRSRLQDSFYRLMRDDVRDALDAGSGPIWDALMSHAKNNWNHSGKVLSTSDIASILRSHRSHEYGKMVNASFDSFMTHARLMHKLPWWVYDYSIQPATRIVGKSAGAAKLAYDMKGFPARRIQQAAIIAGLDKAQAEAAASQLKSIFSPDRSAWKEDSATKQYTQHARVRALQLASYATTLLTSTIGALQLSQIAPMVALMGGVNSAKGAVAYLGKTLNNARIRRLPLFQKRIDAYLGSQKTVGDKAKLIGRVVNDMFFPSKTSADPISISGAIEIDNLRNLHIGEAVTAIGRHNRKLANVNNALEKAASVVTAVTGQGVIDGSLRRWSAHTAKSMAESMVGTLRRRYPDGLTEAVVTSLKDSDPEIKFMWRFMKLTAKEIVEIATNGVPDALPSGIADSPILNKIYGFGSEVQGRTSSAYVPHWVSSTTWGRGVTQFLNFSHAQAQLAGLAFSQALNGNPVPLAKYLAATYAAQKAVEYISFGRETDDENKNAFEKGFEGATGQEWQGVFGLAGYMADAAARHIEKAMGLEEYTFGSQDRPPEKYGPKSEDGPIADFMDEMMNAQMLGYFNGPVMSMDADSAANQIFRWAPGPARFVARGVFGAKEAFEGAKENIENEESASDTVLRSVHEVLYEISPEYRRRYKGGQTPLGYHR